MKAYQLKITIKGSKPPIWRRCIVPSELTFSQLGIILNQVMGWTGCHLSEFDFCYLGLQIIEGAAEFDECDDYAYAEASVTLIEEYMERSRWFTYTYDLGDCWEHRVDIETVILDYPFNYPLVIKFKGACPMEDCGGIDGYYRFLEILSDPAHPEYAERKSWLERRGYDDHYDFKAVNQELKETCCLPWDEEHEAKETDTFDSIEAEGTQLHYLQDVFDELPKAVLVAMAREKGIVNAGSYRREQLAGLLSSKMLEPEEIKTYFSCLSNTELSAFEDAVDGMRFFMEEEVFDRLYTACYVGMLENGRIVVPVDVYHVYQKIKSSAFERQRQVRSWLLSCFDVAEALYGVVPAEVMALLYNTGAGEHIDVQTLVKEAEQIPDCFCKFTYANGCFYLSQLYPDDKQLMACQGAVKFYIPTRTEIIDMEEHGYFAGGRHISDFTSYLGQKKGINQLYAKYLAREVQRRISGAANMQDILEYLQESGLSIESLEEMKVLGRELSILWNNTRMLLNRGYTQSELTEDEECGMGNELRLPSITVLDGGKQGEQQPVKKNVKTVYTNTMYSPGSSKKYKAGPKRKC